MTLDKYIKGRDTYCSDISLLGDSNLNSIKIGSIVIDDVEVSKYGVITKIGKTTRESESSSWMEDMNTISSRNLRHLIIIAYNVSKAGYKITQMSTPVLIEYTVKLLKCSKRTAYNYVNTLKLLTVCID